MNGGTAPGERKTRCGPVEVMEVCVEREFVSDGTEP